MKCTRFCGPRISLRRALFLAAAQIILALIIANSDGPERTDDAAGSGLGAQVASSVDAS